MKKAFHDSRWWFYIPIFNLFCIRKISKWCFESETTIEFLRREILFSLLIIPNCIIGIAILQFLYTK